MAMLFILMSFAISCGSPRTLVKVTNKADGTDTRITVNQGSGGETHVTVSPKVQLDSISFQFNPIKTK